MLNLSMFLEDSARKYPSRDALVLGDDRFTYAETDGLANQVANLLVASGIVPGDRVAISCPNLPWFPIVYYGILKAGAVVVPLNVLLKGREIAYHLQDCGAVAYFCFEGGPDLPIGEYGRDGFDEAPSCRTMFVIGGDGSVAAGSDVGITALSTVLPDQPSTFESVAREATDTAVILYTSGTTGRPKGAELTQSNMVMNAIASNRLFDSSPSLHDTHLLTLPLFHSFGQTINMNAGFSVGATLVLLPRFEASAALDIMERESITMFAGVPTMYWGLLGAVDDSVDVGRIAANLRKAISGGAALPVEILERFARRFGVQILEGYGLSETSPVALFSDPEQAPRAGSIGIPIWGVDVRLVDRDWNTVDEIGAVGELAIRGHNVMKGYYGRPEATDEVMRDGWFRTGDLARRDDDGFYYIVDRAKDMIVRGGFNVYPREIEEVLMTHEAVSLAAVIGVPHESHGEEVRAYVIPHEGSGISADELIAWSKDRMASYKYPREVRIVDQLPMTGTGKILKRELV
ncbi:long-chain fatty acid--CoA ligase [Rhodococcus sp. TAF43]|uniref:long-chain-fatty-acid--CoA ligase n=1 Tax=unclassified Rhodococcus (in: high G+C Gram-positive bacteria) TaxID=192944 RepID=UPI000E0A39D4|nr:MULTISPECIES: long-chain fatty acid--CoA ligase [unclassified Rhodococcus (in: high G+C Gram-positive bacteria)]QKT10396.1 long-chain fatty acid--CoA ligase [Rhodococcus sp. W8901]RDI35527.1 long-chain acyl-CoA synthetase [Rhodococcus sp. AG1013]